MKRYLTRSLNIALACSLLALSAHAKDKMMAPLPSASAVQVDVTTAGDTVIPAEFRYAVYELLISHLEKSGTFQKVYRVGDRNAATTADLVTLHTEVAKFKEGSQMTRELVKVAGWTKVDVNVKVTAKDGKTIVEKTVQGKVRFRGENLNVTRDLAKVITKLMKESFKATGAPTA